MSKCGNFMAFLAGTALGAAAVYLTCTEKGRELAKSGKEAAEKCTDEVLEKIEEIKQAVKESESETEEEN